MTDDKRNKRHVSAMKKKKTLVDEKIKSADIDKGVFIVLTGNGKGKTSSAFGTLVRSLGYGYKVAVTQFIKGEGECGERNFLENNELVQYSVMATGFTWETQNRDADAAAAEKAWAFAKKYLQDESIHLVVLDELTYMLKYGYLDLLEVLDHIKNRPVTQNLIVTGRAASQELMALADTVSEINVVKHAFDDGVKAQRGIEW